jgi:Flp pilus assembly pilin Flp
MMHLLHEGPRAAVRTEDGQTMAEYAVILAVIAIGVIVAITALSGGIGSALDKVTEILP